ncbi:beta-glucanosyltransferase gel2 [Stachybotrys elegans]|uniref:1,3-beta-glucanosyltransferase n=1 Tax=Stachybotrys elegans TaxID=80388 RepID=A0A8K0SNW7_9HYPO|nr:beta-glucanosyltransferase gel2 [Stachybotrys elegans]
MLLQTALVALSATVVSAVTPLEIRGTGFVDPKTGNKFQIAGMAYQPGGAAAYEPETSGGDPLSDVETCKRDAALMQMMGINAIRVYNLSPDLNHDECASVFNAAGMYMMIDVNSPLVGEALTSFEPWTSYYAAYLNRTFAIVEAFSNYPNTLLFFSGNEVINDIPSAEFAPRYIRAVTRDLKNYIKNNIKRKIPVGYSAADVRDVLWDTWNYLTCTIEDEEDNMSQADLFALNSYSWCGPKATFQSSSYDKLVEGLKSSPVPIFFSEYGCNTPQPRLWNEVQSIYGSEMTDVFDGGVVYEWTEEKNNYGIVQIEEGVVSLLGDYGRLSAQYEKIDWEAIQSVKGSDDHPRAPVCRPSLVQEKGFDNNFTIPDVPPGAQRLIDNGIPNAPSGKLVDISNWDVTLEVRDANGDAITGLKVVPLPNDEFNWYGKNELKAGNTEQNNSNDSSDDSSNDSTADESNGESQEEPNAAMAVQPLMLAAALPLLAMVFA